MPSASPSSSITHPLSSSAQNPNPARAAGSWSATHANQWGPLALANSIALSRLAAAAAAAAVRLQVADVV